MANGARKQKYRGIMKILFFTLLFTFHLTGCEVTQNFVHTEMVSYPEKSVSADNAEANSSLNFSSDTIKNNIRFQENLNASQKSSAAPAESEMPQFFTPRETISWTAEALLDKYLRDGDDGYYFIWHDLNGDGTPELLVVDKKEGESVEESLHELTEIIIGAGSFWEEWWGANVPTDRFGYEHVRYIDVPEHLQSLFAELLPSSGFSDLNDIREYLSQFYTSRWIDEILHYNSGFYPPFLEYRGNLYINIARGGFARPDWSNVSYRLVEHQDNLTIIDITLYHGSWHRLQSDGDAYSFEMTHRFTLINGRIDNTPGSGVHLPSY